jgi:hypothetical protein
MTFETADEKTFAKMPDAADTAEGLPQRTELAQPKKHPMATTCAAQPWRT